MRAFVFAAMLAAVLSIPAAAAPDRPRVLLVAGQSLAVMWVNGPAHRAFVASRPDGHRWTVIRGALSASAAMRSMTLPGYEDYWWIDDRRPGPAMRKAFDAIDKAEVKPTVILWSQGQTDAASARASGLTRAEFRAQYKTALLRIFRALRKRTGRPVLSVPIYIETLGPRAGRQYAGDDWVREAQRELVAEHGARLNIHLGPVLPMNLPLRDSVHPSPEGDAIRGWLAAGVINLKEDAR